MSLMNRVHLKGEMFLFNPMFRRGMKVKLFQIKGRITECGSPREENLDRPSQILHDRGLCDGDIDREIFGGECGSIVQIDGALDV